MKKILAATLVLALAAAPAIAVHAEEAQEPITLTVFRGDPGDQPTDDNKIYQKIKDEFGVSFEFELLAGDLDETLGVKIAGEDYPELFDGGNSADLLIQNGALINLLDYLSPETTPRLWAHIEPQKARLITQDEDGNDALYIIPNYGLADGEHDLIAFNGHGLLLIVERGEFAGFGIDGAQAFLEHDAADMFIMIHEDFLRSPAVDDVHAGFERFGNL